MVCSCILPRQLSTEYLLASLEQGHHRLEYVHFAAGETYHADWPGLDLRGADLFRAVLRGSNLNTANLSGARIACADLTNAHLDHADLSGANLYGSTLVNTNLSYANLAGANLNNVDLTGANLSHASLRGANLRNSNLNYADLTGTVLTDANVLNVSLQWARLNDVRLGPLCYTELRSHQCHVDFRAVVRSLHTPGLEGFLLGSGMPSVAVTYMLECAKALSDEEITSLLHSTFISYGGPDEAFAERLNKALKTAGVETFFFPEDAQPGTRLHREMRRGVNAKDRVILVCSRNSLDRPGVQNEIEEVMSREAREGGAEYLIPIRLDDYIFDGWTPPRSDLKQTIIDRVVADFRDTERDERAFSQQLHRLIGALKRRAPHGRTE